MSLIIYTFFLYFRKPITDVSFLDSVIKEGDSEDTSKVDNFFNSLSKNTANKDSDAAKTNQSSKRVDTCVFNSLIDEDIGECVPQQTKQQERKVVKKSKLDRENCDNTESDAYGATKGRQEIKSVNQPLLSSAKKKPKKNLMTSSGGNTKSRSKISKAVKKPQDMESQCSPAFVKLFKAVKKQTRNIDSESNLRKFLQTEKKKRQEKVKGRVSRLLKGADWRKFAKFVRTRLENIQGLSLEDSEAEQHMINKTRVRVKFWLLFPHLKGKKPENWTTILGTLAT